ncbi:MAG TPA: porin [Terriglobales bacterium]|nr:porin [Terriglobales bacterium]
MNRILVLLLAVGILPLAVSGQDRDERIADLERKLAEARNSVAALQKTIEGLTSEVQMLRQPGTTSTASISVLPAPPAPVEDAATAFREQILRPDLAQDERESGLAARPELFIQSRFQALPISGGTQQSAPSNFVLTRMESRWSGRISDKIGMGFEIQYHPAPAGAAVELVNDAFVEYYANDAVTIRTGQFVKPFGFDIQQSSSVRESPERGIFAGYLFPGQRDRGLMVTTKLDRLGGFWHGTQLFAGAFNGNRFFTDNNRQLNYDLRVRKVFDRLPLAIGASAQLGRQLLPEGTRGNNRENLYGVDVQWAWKRLGVRAEFVAGNMPSTLLGLEPEFAPRFSPGAHSAGGSVFSSFRLAHQDQVYWRYDQFNRDLVSGQNLRAVNLGYFRYLGEKSRIGLDYQFKNRVSHNDDLLNTRLQIIWNVMY